MLHAAVPQYTDVRVGNWTAAKKAPFDIVADEANNTLHFVYADSGSVYYSQSVDGGTTWTPSEFVTTGLFANRGKGISPKIALDSAGTVHLVYKTATTKAAYRYRSESTWSSAQDITTSVPGQTAYVAAPQIAVDGGDNVHIIYWSPWAEGDWKEGSRCVYYYKPAGQGFVAPELWTIKSGSGLGTHGTLAVDKNGDIHIFYVTQSDSRAKFIERKVRFKSGDWGQHDQWSISGVNGIADWSMAASIGSDGVVHLCGQMRALRELKVRYLNNRDNPNTLVIQHSGGLETAETYTDLLLLSWGDIWMATGHWEFGEEGVVEGMPNLAAYYYYEAASGRWNGPVNVSPNAYQNLDLREGMNPKLVLFNNEVRLFYAEQKPGKEFEYYQRIFKAKAN